MSHWGWPSWFYAHSLPPDYRNVVTILLELLVPCPSCHDGLYPFLNHEPKSTLLKLHFSGILWQQWKKPHSVLSSHSDSLASLWSLPFILVSTAQQCRAWIWPPFPVLILWWIPDLRTLLPQREAQPCWVCSSQAPLWGRMRKDALSTIYATVCCLETASAPLGRC